MMNTVQQQSRVLLWNRSSGWSDSDEIRRKLESILSSGGARVDVKEVERGMNIQEESNATVASGADVLIAAGGDGTINAAASALVHQPTALGVIPAGTLNHFARDLTIPLEPEEAARALVEGRTIQVDAAAVNGRVFINNSVLGLFPNYRVAREAWERHGFGSTRVGRFVATLAAVVKVFWRLPHLTVSLEVEGRRRTLRTPFVLVGNNEHRMEGLALGKRTRLDAGALWVYVLRPCSRWQLLRMIVGLITRRAVREDIFEIFRASHVTIDSKRRRIGVGIDGEMVRMHAPLHYECLPGALRVVVPASYPPLPEPAI
jgi:diacylglycerol kinase family enzyme